jgi:methenyltetrahydrofolate cyclohydrolase
MLGRRVVDLLDDVAARTPAPGGGAAAALTVALAAALAEMAARFSRERWAGAGRASSEAASLRHRAAPLAQADADAYAEVLRSRRLPPDDPDRPAAIAAAVERAVSVPLEIARAAAAVAALAADLVEHGNENLRGDAGAAVTLAAAAGRIAASLVSINLEGDESDPRVLEARDLAVAAASLDG